VKDGIDVLPRFIGSLSFVPPEGCLMWKSAPDRSSDRGTIKKRAVNGARTSGSLVDFRCFFLARIEEASSFALTVRRLDPASEKCGEYRAWGISVSTRNLKKHRPLPDN